MLCFRPADKLKRNFSKKKGKLKNTMKASSRNLKKSGHLKTPCHIAKPTKKNIVNILRSIPTSELKQTTQASWINWMKSWLRSRERKNQLFSSCRNCSLIVKLKTSWNSHKKESRSYRLKWKASVQKTGTMKARCPLKQGIDHRYPMISTSWRSQP